MTNFTIFGFERSPEASAAFNGKAMAILLASYPGIALAPRALLFSNKTGNVSLYSILFSGFPQKAGFQSGSD